MTRTPAIDSSQVVPVISLDDYPLEERTIARMLERQVARLADHPLLRFDGDDRSYAEVQAAARGLAAAFAEAGIGKGDRVALMSENRPEVLEALLACAYLGAILVPVNPAFRGQQLEHVLADSGCVALAIEAGLVPHLDILEGPLPNLERLWTLGPASGSWQGREFTPFPAPAGSVAPHPAEPGDPVVVLYTSGTTGPSKGVVCSNAQVCSAAAISAELIGIQEGDVAYTCLPLFHTNALNAFIQAVHQGATFALGPRFSASAFWERLITADATVTYLLGTMVQILDARPPGPDDRGHRVRVALAPATSPDLRARFTERFGIQLVDGWGSTETSFVLFHPGDDPRPGSLGKVLDVFEAQVVDANDAPVPDGEPGELVLRNKQPFTFSSGYLGLPERTVEAWRNLWFHTGDRVVREPDGAFRFVDRIKESVRRRGENISVYEVESVLTSHPDVATAAVVPVPSDLGDEEVLACVVLRDGASLEPEELIRHCEGRIAYFAIPRYVEFMSELPVTASNKVEKHRLRERGVTPSTWDREAAGYVLQL